MRVLRCVSMVVPGLYRLFEYARNRLRGKLGQSLCLLLVMQFLACGGGNILYAGAACLFPASVSVPAFDVAIVSCRVAGASSVFARTTRVGHKRVRKADSSFTAQVAHVYDGDTLKLTSGERVRLLAINTPELAHNGNKAGVYAEQAHGLLKQLAANRRIRFLTGSRPYDSYGRILATAFLPDGRNINEFMIASGAAYFYWHKDTSAKVCNYLIHLQNTAIDGRRGMWALAPRSAGMPKTHAGGTVVTKGRKWSDVFAEGGALYVGNRRSKRFFSRQCDGAQRIGNRNRVPFQTLLDAFAAGYSPARHCGIWPDMRD